MKNEKQIVALTHCFICNEGDKILINRRMQDMSEYHGKVIDKEPCPKCKDYMKQGVILISVRDGESANNPFRTGGWCVVKDEANMFQDIEQMKPMLKSRVGFIEDSAWLRLGLPISDYQKTLGYGSE